MVNIAVVRDDLALDNGALDDLGLRRGRRRAGPLPLPLLLDDADVLVVIGRGRAGAPLDETSANPLGGRTGRSIALNDTDPVNLAGASARGAHSTEAEVLLGPSHLDRADAPRPDMADGARRPPSYALRGLDLALPEHQRTRLGPPDVVAQEGGHAVAVALALTVHNADLDVAAAVVAVDALAVVKPDPASARHGGGCEVGVCVDFRSAGQEAGLDCVTAGRLLADERELGRNPTAWDAREEFGQRRVMRRRRKNRPASSSLPFPFSSCG